MTIAKRRQVKLGTIMAGGLLLGVPCISPQTGQQLATNTTTTIANLLINSFLVQPVADALEERNATE